jgi:hypothetical protein
MTTTITRRVAEPPAAGNTARVAGVKGFTHDAWGGHWGTSWGLTWTVPFTFGELGLSRRITADASTNNTKRITGI